MSGNFHTDDQNFSFTLPRLDENTWFSVAKPETSLRFFFYAVGASLVIHLAVALWLPFKRILAVPTASSKTIHIELQYATPFEATVIEESPVEAPPFPEDVSIPIPEIVEEPETVNEDEQIVEDSSSSTAIEPEVLDEADIQTAIQSINHYRESYLGTDTTGMRVDSSPHKNFGDVFDPRLRARLQNNRAIGRSERPSAGATIDTIYGETMVEVEEGRCLMGREARVGEPTNWYMTKCSTYKDEGEQMMERVNRAVKRRR